MNYKGHVEKGTIVLDEPADLKDGDQVVIQVVEHVRVPQATMPLRGAEYELIAPFDPAVSEKDWDAAQ